VVMVGWYIVEKGRDKMDETDENMLCFCIILNIIWDILLLRRRVYNIYLCVHNILYISEFERKKIPRYE
jgi:hypothetical protein